MMAEYFRTVTKKRTPKLYGQTAELSFVNLAAHYNQHWELRA